MNGFDDTTRITEDYEFYTRAIVRFGIYFLGQPTAFYRVGNVDALWNPLGLEGKAKTAHEAEVAEILKQRKSRLRHDMGNLKFFSQKTAFRSMLFLLNKTFVRKLQKAEISKDDNSRAPVSEK